MYIKKSDANLVLKSNVEALIESLKTKNAKIGNLSDGDDWSFVIKVQTLIESTITNALLAKIGEDGLSKTLQVMPLVGDQVSKLSLSKDLEITTSAQRRFITRMASLRNQLAHDPKHDGFTFGAYIFNFDKNQRKEWKLAIPWFSETPEFRNTWAQYSLEYPKPVIHLASFVLIALLETSASEASVLRQVDKLSIATTTELLRVISP